MIRSLLFFTTLSLVAADLPPAEQILDRYTEATGGAAAYQALRSQRITADIEFVGQGIKGTSTQLALTTGHATTVLELAGLGKMHSGVWNGHVWESSAMQGQRLATGAERDLQIRMNDPQAAIHWRKHYTSVTTEAEEDINGEACYRVLAQPTSGKPETSWYSKSTGLLVKARVTIVSPMGEIPMEILASDYRPVGPFRIAHKSIQQIGPQKIASTIREAVFNEALEMKQLQPPPEIEALIAKAKSAQ